jgi:hypothetical protein
MQGFKFDRAGERYTIEFGEKTVVRGPDEGIGNLILQSIARAERTYRVAYGASVSYIATHVAKELSGESSDVVDFDSPDGVDF